MLRSKPAIFDYRPQLDGLRAIAVAPVLLTHFIPSYTTVFEPLGFSGVRLFFVLSGYLITAILLNHRTLMEDTRGNIFTPAINFYVRRALRLFPIFYGALFVAWITQAPHFDATWIWHATYLTNVLIALKGDWVYSYTHFWSLAVEEQFYLLWVWVILGAPRNNLAPICFIAIAIAPLFRISMYLLGYSWHADLLLPGCVDLLAIGSLLAVTLAHQRTRSGTIEKIFQQYIDSPKWFLALLGVIFISVIYGFDHDYYLSRILENSLAAALFVLLVYRADQSFSGVIGSTLENSAMIALGRISYGVYVIHNFVPGLISKTPILWRVSSLPEYWAAIVYIVVTIGLAILSWKIIERPILRMKTKFSEGLGSHD
jgi:peptidoglycan/LPS O-acetylase OafA/YrhL